MTDGNTPNPAPKPAPKPTPATAKATKTATAAGKWLTALVFVFLAGMALWPLMVPVLSPWVPARFLPAYATSTLNTGGPDLAPLTARVTALERRVAALPTADGKPPTPDKHTEDWLVELETRLQTLESGVAESTDDRPGSQALAALGLSSARNADTLAGLSRRVAALEARPGRQGGDPTITALAVTLARLSRRVESGATFVADLDRVAILVARLHGPDQAAGPMEQALETLRGAAVAGLASVADLGQEFSRLAGDILRADADIAAQGWWQSWLAPVSNLVIVRRTGELPGGGAEAVVARTETHLSGGDLAAAVAELQTLDNITLEPAAGWIEAAQQRLHGLNALDVLDAGLATAVTPASAAPHGPDEAKPLSPKTGPKTEPEARLGHDT